jgi:outer membrane receptor protein involved in Fe transport
LRYDITDWLYLQGRVGMDWYTRRDQFITPQGTSYQRGGSISEGEDRIREINMEYIVGFNKAVGPVTINAFAGGNRMRRTSERISANGNGFNIAFAEFINNAASRNYGYGFNEWGINSLFGSVEVGYNNYLYLTATGRQDWFSLLNPETNDVFYPSGGLSFVFTEVLGTLPSWLSYGKVRGSWAQVGNVTISPYSTNLTYSLRGESHLGRPLASFSQAIGNNGSIPNPNLVPLQSQEYEFGFDLRFLHNRLGLDFTYYNQETSDDEK